MSILSKNKKLVMDYVLGNDLDVDIDELENDLDFMIAAIDYSNDINMYNILIDELKYDLSMMKFLINKFHDNLPFIIKIATEFIDNYKYSHWADKYLEEDTTIRFGKDVELLEVLITVDNYLPVVFEPEIIELKLKLKSRFEEFRIEFETIKEKHKNEEWIQKLGNGFEVIEILYPTSYIIKDYYAKEMVSEIIKYLGDDFENSLHKLYSNKPKNGLIALKEIISKSDKELANYILVRQNLLTDYIEKINTIINNWEKYEELELEKRVDEVVKVVNNYYYFRRNSLVMDEADAIKYFAEKMGMTEVFKKYDPFTYECVSIMIKDPAESIADQKMIKELFPIIKGILTGEIESGEFEQMQVNKCNPNSNIIKEFVPKRG